jgi:LysM repeat protein
LPAKEIHMGPDDKVGAGVGQPASIAAQQRMGVSPQRGLPAGAVAPAGTLRFGQTLNQVRLAAPLTVALNQKEQAGPAALLPPSLVEASAPPSTRTVAAGDTLSSIVKEQALARGVQLTGSQTMRMVQQVASANKISNPNRIFPGQHINLSSLTSEIEASRAGTVVAVAYQPTPAATALKSFQAASSPSSPSAPQPVKSNSMVARHEVLDKTLNRAVSKGFIPANEKGDVRDKILELAKNHRFNPDDFARMTLMESDGMNPRASNQRCHGIIQFCDGSDRGAASAGYAANPKAILGLSVYQQLHLVDKYFDDVGLKSKGPAGLDDLYLSVLQPSARSETRSDAPLAVSGTQAKSLYEGRDTNSPMTRQSILQGLLKNAADRLGQPGPTNGRLQAMRTAAYDENAPQVDPPSNPLR